MRNNRHLSSSLPKGVSQYDDADCVQPLPRKTFFKKRTRIETLGVSLIVLPFLYASYSALDNKMENMHLFTDVPEVRLSPYHRKKADDSIVLSVAVADKSQASSATEVDVEHSSAGICSDQRASLRDRNGNLLAVTVDSKSTFSYDNREYRPTDKKEILDLGTKIHQIVPSIKVERIMESFHPSKKLVVLSRHVSPDQVRKIKALEGMFSPAMKVTPNRVRVYPQRALFAHVMGGVKEDQCARGGIEKSHNAFVQDQNEDLTLSLDVDVQNIVRDELMKSMIENQAVAAMGVVMNIHTGEIIAEVSLPDFDLNQARYLANNYPKLWKKVQKNRILNDNKYEYGSLLKIQNTALALQEGMSLDTVFDTTSQLRVDGHNIGEPFRPRFDYALTEILIKSSNWGSARMALEIGSEKQIAFLTSLGLIGKTFSDPHRPKVNVATVAYGYGIAIGIKEYMASTAALLNGGFLIKPTYMLQSDVQYAQQVFSSENSLLLNQLLLTNVAHQHGTGKGAYKNGVLLGGKTGTAKLKSKTKTAEGKDYKEDTLASFLGVFPANKPKYMILGTLFEPKTSKGKAANAGAVTAPVVGEIAQRIATKYNMLLSPEQTKKIEQALVLRTQFDDPIPQGVYIAQN